MKFKKKLEILLEFTQKGLFYDCAELVGEGVGLKLSVWFNTFILFAPQKLIYFTIPMSFLMKN